MDNFPILYLLTVPWHIRLSSFQILVTLAHGINKSWLAEKLPELTKISSGSLTANQKAGIRWARVTNSRVGLATSYTFGDGFGMRLSSSCEVLSCWGGSISMSSISESILKYSGQDLPSWAFLTFAEGFPTSLYFIGNSTLPFWNTLGRAKCLLGPNTT